MRKIYTYETNCRDVCRMKCVRVWTGGNPVYVDELHKFMNFYAEDFIRSWQKPSQEVTWKKNLSLFLNFFRASRNKKRIFSSQQSVIS